MIVRRVEPVGTGRNNQLEQLLSLLRACPRGLESPPLVEFGQQRGRGDIHTRHFQPAGDLKPLDLEPQRLAEGALRHGRACGQIHCKDESDPGQFPSHTNNAAGHG